MEFEEKSTMFKVPLSIYFEAKCALSADEAKMIFLSRNKFTMAL